MADGSLNILLSRTVGIDHIVDHLGERYTPGCVLGEGQFSQVRLATQLDDDGKCALKGVSWDVLEDDDDALKTLQAEVAALRLIRGQLDIQPHVVQLHEVLQVTGDSV